MMQGEFGVRRRRPRRHVDRMRRALAVVAVLSLAACERSQPDAAPTESESAPVSAAPNPISPLVPAGCDGCNVVVVLIDTLRADHLGTYGYSRDTSPNIDALAKKSLVFQNMIAQSTWTKPGTATLLTGLYPKNHGANTHEDRLADDHLLLSEYLQKAGYTTHAFVANGNAGPPFNFDRGYGTYEFFAEDPKRIGVKTRSDRMNERLLPYVANMDVDERFFLYVHYVDPHSPYDPGERFFSKSNTIKFDEQFFTETRFKNYLGEKKERAELIRQLVNEYDDEIRFNDSSFGELMSVLASRGVLDETIVVVVSDHGEELLERDAFGHTNAPYEDQVRVPLVVYLPGVGHRVVNEQVGQVDLVPSLMSVLGLELPAALDGEDLFRGFWHGDVSYAEIDSKHRKCAAVWRGNEKLTKCEQTSAPGKEKSGESSRWFESVARFPFDGEVLDLHIQSFHESRQLRVSADGELVQEITVRPRRQNIRIELGAARPRLIEIESRTPCRRPIDLGVNNSRLCLSFRLFGQSNFDLERMTVPTNSYYVLDRDRAEERNAYYLPDSTNRVRVLEQTLAEYLEDRLPDDGGSNKVELSESQKETLRALGYLE